MTFLISLERPSTNESWVNFADPEIKVWNVQVLMLHSPLFCEKNADQYNKRIRSSTDRTWTSEDN